MSDKSPNELWALLGAEIFRNGLIRTIGLDGETILKSAGHEEETRKAKELAKERGLNYA